MQFSLKTLHFFLILFILSACEKTSNSLKISGKTMGTHYHITVVTSSSDVPALQLKLQQEVDELLIKINQQMSTYIPDSEVSQFNKYSKNDWFLVSKDTAFVVLAAQSVSKLSSGAFDITVAPLIDLWGFGAKTQFELPTEDQIDKASESVGYNLLEARTSPPALRKKNSKLRIDLSAIAKGFAVDKISEYLKQKGYSDFLVEIGGEVYSQGINFEGNPWRVAIEMPDSIHHQSQVLLISNISLATSGDYRNYFVKGGVRYSHTLNPTTGRPITHKLASVTILHESAMMADAYATALSVMGEVKGKLFAKKQKISMNMIVRNKESFSVWQNIDEAKMLQTGKKCKKWGGCIYFD